MLVTQGSRATASCLLAVHSVGHTTVTGNTMAKVLDIKSSFESRREKSAERCHKRSERRHYNKVEVVRHVGDAFYRQSELRMI